MNIFGLYLHKRGFTKDLIEAELLPTLDLHIEINGNTANSQEQAY